MANNKLSNELLNRELRIGIGELRYIVDRFHMDYNHYDLQSSLDYLAPASFAAICIKLGLLEFPPRDSRRL